MAQDFLEGPEVTLLVARAREIKASKKAFSDIVDKDGYQYVDLVQEGGGVLGIALVGYTYILEQAGIRFYSLAGTSAGAIHALLMAGMSPVGESSSMKILKSISDKDLLDLVDGPPGIKKLIQDKIEGKTGLWGSILWNGYRIYSLLKNKLGLNPGDAVEEWLAGLLKSAGIETYADLKNHRKILPQLQNTTDNQKSVNPPKIAIIASEISTNTKVELPAMASLYWKDVDEINPARFVRTSLSIPIFFYPFIKDNIPDAGSVENQNWIDCAGYHGVVPESVKFVDGGLLSNFPINIFHVQGVPSRPTFGARLSTYRKKVSDTSTFFSFNWAIISTMRQIHDYDFIHRNPDYRQLICNIDADEEFNWLDFNMSRDRQKQLFVLGARKGLEFLENFNWENYKTLRAKLTV